MADTTVDTPAGPVPIQAIGVGDQVLSRDQECPDEPVRPAPVTRVVRSVAPMILWLTLAGGQTMGVTPGHEVWTHQAGWTHAAALDPGDTFAGRDGRALPILSVRVDPTPTLIYNLEVDGTFTYFANGAWVHNNSCPISRGFRPRSKWHHGQQVWFDEFGWPDFSPHATADVRIAPTGSRARDVDAANAALGVSSTPSGHVWHHHQDTGRMQLVPEDLHRAVGHDGGFSVWGKPG